MNIKNRLTKFKNSNNKLYYLINNKKLVVGFFAILAFIFGIIGFTISEKTNGVLDVINNTIALFAFAYPDDDNIYLDIAKILAIIGLFGGAISFFLHRVFNHLVVSSIVKKPYSLVVGLGEISRYYLDSEIDRAGEIVIIESNPQNPYLDHYIAKGFGLYVGDILDNEVIQSINLSNLQQAIISSEDDKRNLEILIKLTDSFADDEHKRVYIHSEEFALQTLFMEGVVSRPNIEVVPFSFYELVAKNLFSEHSILGDKQDIAMSSQPYSIAVIGSGELAIQVIYQLLNIAHLSNENKLSIYCVDSEADKFIKKIKNRYIYVDKISNIKLVPINDDIENGDFYQNKIWFEANLTNIIIIDENEQNNLNIALKFYNRSYLKLIGSNRLKTKVLYASYTYSELSRTINDNSTNFRQFYSFGNRKDIFHRDNLVNEKMNFIAKLIHYGYGDVYQKDLLFDKENREIDKKWFKNSSINDKVSNKMQSLHLDIKLLSLGLKKEKSNKSTKELLKINRELFDKKLGHREINDSELLEYSKELEKFYSGKEYKIKYFPKKFESLFEKLIRAEHNRWNAYHYLGGWNYSEVKNKAIKEHDCLLPLDKFDKDSIKITIIYDIYSLLYIPNLLASGGYKLVSL